MTDEDRGPAGETAAKPLTASAEESAALYGNILRTQAAWIAGLQLDSGAIPTYGAPIARYGDKFKVIPYFTHIALLGLLEQPEHASVVRRYMDWYFAHLVREATETAPEGSVYDYEIAGDRRTEAATGDFDSTDSYASTFLNLLRKYAETTGDTAYLRARRGDIRRIAGAMLATKQDDGLTWAKPNYRVKYLMDNAEVYIGLADMEWISRVVFGDEEEAAAYRRHKEEVHEGIENGLWNETKQAYAYAKSENGSLHEPEWSSFYPDATAQLFPIWTGLLEPGSERAKRLYAAFNEHHPGWAELSKSDAFPWALIAYTAALMGDGERAGRFLRAVRSAYIDRGHPWPWYVMESGVTMLAAARLRKRLHEAH